MKTLKDRLSLAAASAAFRAMALLKRFKEIGMTKDATAAPAGRIYGFTMKTIDGKDKSLADYKGRVLLVVNTASLCGFTPQYDSLEAVHARFKEKGLTVLGFPANEFGAQEPGSDSEIKEFCRTRFSISFDLFSKIVVKGAGIHPLYKFLTAESGFNGPIGWNFSKFLIDRKGRVAARFGPEDDPNGKAVAGKISELLAA